MFQFPLFKTALYAIYLNIIAVVLSVTFGAQMKLAR